jgi:phage tail-like protein
VAPKSSWLRYLPPVLWEDEPEDPELSLGGLLRIFEKVLTGIDDGVPTPRRPLTGEIAGIPRLFDPWTAPSTALPWLAGLVDLRFPTLQGRPVWSEHQQRVVIARIAETYRRRGSPGGLAEYLDLTAVGALRPRIAVDDGSRVLTTTPGPGRPAPVTALVTRGPVLDLTRTGPDAVLAEGLVRPRSLALGPDDALYVADLGPLSPPALSLTGRVWRLSADGAYEVSGDPPKPVPLLTTTQLQQRTVVGLAVRPPAGGGPPTLLLLDQVGRLAAFGVPGPGAAPTSVPPPTAAQVATQPVAMCLDGNGDLLVLDRGVVPPEVAVVTPAGQVTRHPLASLRFPLSLAVLRDGALLIGDGRSQEVEEREDLVGTVIRVDRRDPGSWVETELVPTGAGSPNPLVAPTGIAQTGDGSVFVLDAGLKPFGPPPDPFVLAVAEPAAVYQLDPEVAGAPVRRVTETGRMVYPTAMVARGPGLVIADPGQPQFPGPVRLARVAPHRFEVVMHFTGARLPPEDPDRAQTLSRAVLDLEVSVDAQKPAHTHWTPVTTS